MLSCTEFIRRTVIPNCGRVLLADSSSGHAMIIDQCNISNAGLRIYRHYQRSGLTNVSCVIRYLTVSV